MIYKNEQDSFCANSKYVSVKSNVIWLSIHIHRIVDDLFASCHLSFKTTIAY